MSALGDWNLVRTFLVVARHTHRGDAARQLGLSVRTLARHVQMLEDELGAALVRPASRRIVLTPTGAQLHDALSGPVAEVDAALRDARLRARSSLRIAISTELPTRWANRLGAWVEWPARDAQVELRSHGRALERVRDGRFDAALVTGEPSDERARLVGDEPAVVVFPADHPAAARTAIRAGDLADLPVAFGEPASPEHRRGVSELLTGDPDGPTVVARSVVTFGQGLIHTARTHRAAAVTLAAVTERLDTAGLAVRPLDPPLAISVTLVARAELPEATFTSLGDHLVDAPGRG